MVQLYGQGVARRKVAALMLKFLAPPDGEADRSKRMRTAIKRLKQMEERKWFRDALWDHSMIQADLQTPQIIQGVVRKAKRGRVDAAKLALGLVGRYEEGPGVQQATQVNVVFGAEVPRPSNRSMERQGEADVVEDADWDEVD